MEKFVLKFAAGVGVIACCLPCVVASGADITELCKVAEETADLRSKLNVARTSHEADNAVFLKRAAELEAINKSYAERIAKLRAENESLKAGAAESIKKIEGERVALENFSRELDVRLRSMMANDKIRAELEALESDFCSRFSALSASKKFRALLLKIEKLFSADSNKNGIFVKTEAAQNNAVVVERKSVAEGAK